MFNERKMSMIKFYERPGVKMCKWPRNQSTLQYGGLSTLQYGGLSTLQYGGLSTLQYGGLSTLQYGGLSTLQYGGLSTLQYGGLSTLQYGGLSTLEGGGLSTSSVNVYMSNIPPWSIFVKYLYEHGYSNYADFIVEQFEKANLPLLPLI